jgi:hypothetical protein
MFSIPGRRVARSQREGTSSTKQRKLCQLLVEPLEDRIAP